MKIIGSGNVSRSAQKPPKPQKPKRALTKKQIIKRIVLAVAIVLALCAAGAAVWAATSVHAPDPMQRANDPTVVDTENGDAPSLNMGDRVSDYFTFVVGAVDEDQTRTDALMVCGFDTKNKKIELLNIPRDTMSDVSRKGAAKKINAAYGTKGGIEQTKIEIKKLIGFSPDYYIIVNFKGIADIVDAIGGVDYEIPFRMYYKDSSQNLDIDFTPGMRHLNGEEVVEFLRWRKNNGGVKTGDPHYTGGDEERIDKQQEFLQYLAAQVLQKSNISNIATISKTVFDNVKTDLSAGEILWMGMQAVGTPSENIKMHKLPGYDSYSSAGTSWYGAFFFPNEEKTLEMINEYFNPYVNKLTDLDVVSGPDKTYGTSTKSSSSSKTHTKHTEDTSSDSEKKSESETTKKSSTGTESGGTSASTSQKDASTTAPAENSGGTSDTSDGGAGTAPADSGTDSSSESGSGTSSEEQSNSQATAPTGSSSTVKVTQQSGGIDPEA